MALLDEGPWKSPLVSLLLQFAHTNDFFSIFFFLKNVWLHTHVWSVVTHVCLLCGCICKDVGMNLKIDGAPTAFRSHTHPSRSQTSRLLTSSLSLGVPVPHVTQCIRGV